MAIARDVWSQLKATTSKELIRALGRDGWTEEKTQGATRAFIKEGSPRRRLVIHHHPGKTFGKKLLEGLIGDAGWTEEDLVRLRLIRAPRRRRLGS